MRDAAMVNVKSMAGRGWNARLGFAALGIVALSAGSCAKSDDIRPTLRIVSPENGSTLNTSSIFLRIAVTNFTLTSAPDNGEPFIGRWHLYIDGANGVAITTTSATIAEIPPGQHTFYAELANQDDTPINGVAVDSVTLDFPATAPQLTMSAPQPLGLYNSSSVEAALQVANFTLDSANIGAANIAGHGHYHVYVGGLGAPLYDEDALSTVTVTGLDTSATGDPQAPVDLWFALANDDHTPLDPPVFDERLVKIPFNSPRISLLKPANGATVGATFEVAVATANFALVDFAGAPADSAGQGHYEVLVDGSDLGAAFATTSTGWSSRGPGAHRVRVELRSNTGSSLAPNVADKARIVVP